MEKKLNIVNQHLRFQKVLLTEPSKNYYLHIAAEIDHSLFPFFISTSYKKKQIIKQAKKWCAEIAKENGVESAVVFKASIIPPGKSKFLQERVDKVQLAKYDFAILLEVNSPDKIEHIKSSNGYKKLKQPLKVFQH